MHWVDFNKISPVPFITKENFNLFEWFWFVDEDTDTWGQNF